MTESRLKETMDSNPDRIHSPYQAKSFRRLSNTFPVGRGRGRGGGEGGGREGDGEVESH